MHPGLQVAGGWRGYPHQAGQCTTDDAWRRPLIQGAERTLRWVLAVTALTVMGSSLAAKSMAGGRFYPETGHSLEAQFVDFFDASGGVDILGFPITDGFVDPQSNRLIQYTENARMEWVNDDSGGGHAILRPLGEMMGGWQPPVDRSSVDSRGCRYYEQTGHSICYAFLDFFDAHGGLDLFGYPISEFTLQDDRIVQNFQRFRLDWYPEAAAPNQVQVAPLGREQFDESGYSQDLLRPAARGPDGDYRVTQLQTSASVMYPVLPQAGQQRIYIVVRDQNLFPVPGAAVMLVAHLPQGDRYNLMPTTDSQGISRLTLNVGNMARGTKVNIELWVFYEHLQAVARDSFVVW